MGLQSLTDEGILMETKSSLGLSAASFLLGFEYLAGDGLRNYHENRFIYEDIVLSMTRVEC